MYHKHLVLIACFIFSQTLSGQKSLTAIADSLYWEGLYADVVTFSTLNLEKEELSNYDKLGLSYYSNHSMYRLGNFENVWEVALENLELAKALTLTDTADVQIVIDVYQKTGDYAFLVEDPLPGIESTSRGIQIVDQMLSNDPWRLVKLYHKLGALQRQAGNYDLALQSLLAGESIFDRLPESKRSHISPVYKAEIAEVYNETNRPKKAIAIYEKLLAAAYQQENLTRQSIYNNNIGLAYERLSDIGKAIYYQKKSLQARLAKYGEKSVNTINSIINLSNLYLKKGDIREVKKLSRQLYETTLANFAATDVRMADYHLLQSKISEFDGDNEEALINLNKAIELRQQNEVENAGEYLDLLQQKISLQIINGYPKEAKATIVEVISKRKTSLGSVNSKVVDAYVLDFEINMLIGNETEAQKSIDSMYVAAGFNHNLLDLDFEKITSPMSILRILQSEYLLLVKSRLSDSQLVERGNILATATDSLYNYLKYRLDDVESRKNLSNQFKKTAQTRIDFLYKQYITSEDKRAITDEVLSVMESNNNTFLYEDRADETVGKFQIPTSLYNERDKQLKNINNSQNTLSSLSLNGTADSLYQQTLSQNLAAKDSFYEVLEKIELLAPDYFSRRYEYALAETQEIINLLDSDETFISYFFGSEGLYAFYASRNDIGFTKVGSSEEVNENVQKYISLCRQKQSDWASLSSLLYDQLIGSLGLSQNSKLIIVTDGILGLLPFESLYDSETNQFAIYNFDIRYQLSGTLYTRAVTNDYNSGMLAVAPGFLTETQDSINDQLLMNIELAPLPLTYEEVNAISALYDSKMVKGTYATKSNILPTVKDRNTLHFATHTYIDKYNAENSGLVLYGSDSLSFDILTAGEIVNLDLNSNLVTLSACDTGAGILSDGEGIESIGRAFAYAGCFNQVISLWAVNDQSTTAIMKNFYQNMSNGDDKPIALKTAKLNYLSESPALLQHPYYWSAFVYHGDSEPLPVKGFRKTIFLLLGAVMLLAIFIILLRRKVSL